MTGDPGSAGVRERNMQALGRCNGESVSESVSPHRANPSRAGASNIELDVRRYALRIDRNVQFGKAGHPRNKKFRV